MLEHTDRTTFPYPFPLVALGFTLRYPNPLSRHVATADVLSRRLDPETGMLWTTRLLLKRGALPRWAPRGIMERSETWVVEESVLDPWTGELVSVNRNVDHTVVMEVVERQHMRALNNRETEVISSAQITSSWGVFFIRRRIEHFGLARFHRQLPRTRTGVLNSIALVEPGSPWRQAMLAGRRFDRPDEADRLAGRVRQRLQVLRARARQRRRQLEAILRGESAVIPEGEEEAHEATEAIVMEDDEDDVPMTSEEAEELAGLEREEEEEAARIAKPVVVAAVEERRDKKGWRESWLWWWRLTVPGLEARDSR